MQKYGHRVYIYLTQILLLIFLEFTGFISIIQLFISIILGHPEVICTQSHVSRILEFNRSTVDFSRPYLICFMQSV